MTLTLNSTAHLEVWGEFVAMLRLVVRGLNRMRQAVVLSVQLRQHERENPVYQDSDTMQGLYSTIATLHPIQSHDHPIDPAQLQKCA